MAVVEHPGDLVYARFTVTNPSTGALVDADSTPTGTVARNGTDDGSVSVTVTNLSTGRYLASFTIPSDYVAGDEVDLEIAATVSSVTGADVVWRSCLVGTGEDIVSGVQFSSAGLLSVDEFLKRCDWTTVADLVTDTAPGSTPAIPTEAALASNEKLLTLLSGASGHVESAIYSGGRYTLTTLTSLTGAGQDLLLDLIADFTVCRAYDRRPRHKRDVGKPENYEHIMWMIQALANGERTFG